MPVAEEFHQRFGSAPVVVGSAPGRVNLIGEHLDYNGGRSLPLPLTCRTHVALRPRTDTTVIVESVQQPGRVEVSDLEARTGGWADYVLGVLWSLGLAGRGLELLVDGRVPSGSGLSSSAALECAVATAVVELLDLGLTGEQVVAACVRAENDYVGAPTGAMDQTVSVLAEPGAALLVDFADHSHRPVPWAPDGELVVIDTRAAHALVDGEYAARRRSCEEAAAQLGVDLLVRADTAAVERLDDPVLRRRARHVVTEAARVETAVAALEAGAWADFGELLNASHRSLRDDYQVSCDELDVAVSAALDAGALGARMTGGGFGGSAIALAARGGGDAVRAAVATTFEARGFRAPGFVDGAAGGPARVELSRPRG